MDTDAISFNQPTGPRPSSKRDLPWEELERLHAQLGIEPPTATYTLEALEEEVALARRAAHLPAVEGQAQFDSLPFDAPPQGGDHRSRKTWRNFYGPLFFGDRPPPESDESTPSEDGAGTGDTTDH
jgi:hypothetical protein